MCMVCVVGGSKEAKESTMGSNDVNATLVTRITTRRERKRERYGNTI